MRQRLKSVYYFFQKVLRRDLGLLNRIKRENLVVVLNLHQVSPYQNAFWPPLHPAVFDDLLGFLKLNFEVSLFNELPSVKSEKPIAVLSFDDGYYNFIEFALPVLENHGLRANLNLIPSCVESGKPMWNVQLYDFLNTAPISLINEISLPGFNIRLDGDGFNSKLNYGLKISRFLKNRPRAERLELWQSMDKVMQECDFSLTRMMNREEIIGISEQCEIGAHSYSHESMEFEENSFFEDDLLKCTAYFNERLNLPLETYAFPNGSFRTEQIEILRKNGIKNILLVGEDYAKTTEDVFPRFTIYGPSIVETKFQALGINKKI